jgi:thiol-disulfide isomerase/thioredoxin
MLSGSNNRGMLVKKTFASLGIASIFAVLALQSFGARTAMRTPQTLPEFTHTAQQDWLNSPPLAAADLAGTVVLVEFWTFDCINCIRSVPWMQSVQKRFTGQPLTIVSVHTPELAHEKERGNVQAALARLGITFPVLLDTDFSYWKLLNNRYWPAFYLFDASGQLREVTVGELHVGEARALAFEDQMRELIGHSKMLPP